MRAHQEGHQTRYFASFAACIGSTLGVAFAGNLVTFLVFYEMLSLATYPLVIHSESPRAIRSGRKYLTYALTAGVLLLAAVIWTGQAAGTYEFTAGGILNPGALSAPSMRILFLLFIAGVDGGPGFENRELADAPELSMSSLLDTQMYQEITAYFVDHVPLRQAGIEVDAWIDFHILGDTPEPSRVAIGSDGWLFNPNTFMCPDDLPSPGAAPDERANCWRPARSRSRRSPRRSAAGAHHGPATGRSRAPRR